MTDRTQEIARLTHELAEANARIEALDTEHAMPSWYRSAQIYAAVMIGMCSGAYFF